MWLHCSALILATVCGSSAPLDEDTLFGYAVLGVGDVTGDGIGDYAVGSPRFWPRHPPSSVILFSGATGEPIWVVEEMHAEHGTGAEQMAGDPGVGVSLSLVGDLDGDGLPDLIAGLGKGGVRALSSGDGSTLWVSGVPKRRSAWGHGNGVSAVSIPDRSSDGVREVLVGRRGGLSRDLYLSRIEVLSGRDGAVAASFSEAGREGYGMAVGWVEGFGEDGRGAIAVSLQPNEEFGVQLLGLQTLEQIGQLDFDSANSSPGIVPFVVISDRDGGGAQDLALYPRPQGSEKHRALIVSSSTGATLATMDLRSPNEFHVVASVGDVDADGIEDIAYGNDWEQAAVFSGKQGWLLMELNTHTPEYPSFGTAWAIDGVGDLDDDGHDEIIVGITQANSPGLAGHVRIYSGKTGKVLREHKHSDL